MLAQNVSDNSSFCISVGVFHPQYQHAGMSLSRTINQFAEVLIHRQNNSRFLDREFQDFGIACPRVNIPNGCHITSRFSKISFHLFTDSNIYDKPEFVQ